MKNKLFVTLIILFLSTTCFCSISFSVAHAEEISTVANFTNLIVFAKFYGETEFIGDSCGNRSTVATITNNCYDKAEYSVSDYYRKVSNGKINLNNLYLFINGESITLSRERGYYCTKSDDNSIGYEQSEYYIRLNELKQDWSDAINLALNSGATITDFEKKNAYPLSELDKNNDGYIDSITIIYKYSDKYSVSWSDCLWNYQAYSNYLELDCSGKTITSNAYFQMTANYNYVYSDSNSIEFVSLKTMIHETGHIFGLKDLYKTTSVSPVYYMSAMANAISPIPQYISAKEREILGWLDENNVAYIQKSGDYTINVTNSNKIDGIICYKRDIPELNKTLYLEYRKFDGDVNKYDTQQKNVFNQNGEKIKGLSLKSGLLCFLIQKDTLFPNNLYSQSNNWNYQVLGGTYNTKSDAALSIGESIQVGSDLSITVKNLTDNNLTFSISFSEEQESENCNHSLKKIDYSDPTCVDKGNIEYYYCDLCNKYFLKDGTEISLSDTFLDFADHTEVVLAETQSTCTKHGLTAGKKCSVCNKILLAQTEKPLLNHTEGDWIIDKESTYYTDGEKHIECVNCKTILQTQTIPKKEPDNDESNDETKPPINSGDSDNENSSNTPNIPNNPSDSSTIPDIPDVPEQNEPTKPSDPPNVPDTDISENLPVSSDENDSTDYENSSSLESSKVQQKNNCVALNFSPYLFSIILLSTIKAIFHKKKIK